jgi:predicted DCC family thiol-disulfide oxidoreductase YuxK
VSTPAGHGVVLFDGVCMACNRAVRFIANRDRDVHFQFASLDSVQARQLLAAHGIGLAPIDTFVVIDDGRAYHRSDACLRIVRQLTPPWSFLSVLALIPRSIRDALYGAFARNRYRWFGRLSTCPMPSGDLARRFL